MKPREIVKRVMLIPALVGLASTAMYAGACGGGEASNGSDAPGDVIYEGGATDEALVALLAKAPKTDASQAAILDTPADGAVLPGDAAPEFTFHVGGTAQRTAPWSGPEIELAALAAPAGRPSSEVSLGWATAPAGRPASEASLGWAELAALLGPVRAARAHGTPVNGRAYFIVFSTAEREGLVRVFTTKLSYTPDAEAWGKLRAAGAPITVSVLNAIFESNRVSRDGGPFAGEPVTFTIAP